ncbi:MAG: hypothetical protein FH761_05565 [Firmicutes bacterium]|nr:hypothetical protein [Bacillota bacterium]
MRIVYMTKIERRTYTDKFKTQMVKLYENGKSKYDNAIAKLHLKYLRLNLPKIITLVIWIN